MTPTRLPLRIGVALALVAGIAWALTHRQLFDADTIGSAVNQLGVWAPAGFVVVYAAATVLFFSGAVLSLAGGALFGPVWGRARELRRDGGGRGPGVDRPVPLEASFWRC